ncbi:MAG: lipopolysaccharide biosynthesis protein [Prevotella sp.]|nr:lipopolysaccharide biosynthesis protein [Prevotella sp.]
MPSLNAKIVNATKWSGLTEIAVRLVLPFTNMVLARLLTPEAFGIVATITMIILFSEIFTDAGFQKYLIQHEFIDDEDREQSTTVAFWSNLFMSLFIWAIIAIFSDRLAILVGNPGFGEVITIACVSIPLAAFSSIQMALYKRDFDFKTLFKVRMVSVAVPLLVTIPLAIWLRSFWALVIGTIVRDTLNAVLLTALSRWKPRLFYSWKKLHEMFSFSIWSMVEAITIWMTGYVDIFIVGIYLSMYYVGIYKTAMGTVGQIMNLVTASTTPVLFAALSRVQNDRKEFENIFYRFMKVVGIVVIPFGIGLFSYRQLAVDILLGDQWGDAIELFGLWALSNVVVIMLCHYCSEVYRSLGKPIYSVLSQVLYMLVMIPTVWVAVKYDFRSLYLSKVVVRFFGVFFNFGIMYFLVKMSPMKMVFTIAPSLLCAIAMAVVAYFLQMISTNILWRFTSIVICAAFYFAFLLIFPAERKICLNYGQKLLLKAKSSIRRKRQAQ